MFNEFDIVSGQASGGPAGGQTFEKFDKQVVPPSIGGRQTAKPT